MESPSHRRSRRLRQRGQLRQDAGNAASTPGFYGSPFHLSFSRFGQHRENPFEDATDRPSDPGPAPSQRKIVVTRNPTLEAMTRLNVIFAGSSAKRTDGGRVPREFEASAHSAEAVPAASCQDRQARPRESLHRRRSRRRRRTRSASQIAEAAVTSRTMHRTKKTIVIVWTTAIQGITRWVDLQGRGSCRSAATRHAVRHGAR